MDFEGMKIDDENAADHQEGSDSDTSEVFDL